MDVVIAGGGTAGHVFPGLALAGELVGRGHQVSFIGTQRGLESRLIPQAGLRFHAVEARPLVRKVSPAALRAPFVALRSVRACRELVRGVDAVVGMGGYVSVSAVLAARRERVPVVLHEQNAIPGLANRYLSRLSRAVAVSFAETGRLFPRRTSLVLTGNPVRREILRVPEERESLVMEAGKEFDLDEQRKTVVVFGGSQGALHINRAAVGATRLLAGRSDLQVLLITGPAHLEGIGEALHSSGRSLPVRLLGYLERMELAYACADLMVSRAGATTVAELTVCALPSLLIPYPYATRQHQEANARALQRAGAATVLADDQLAAESLTGRIEALVDHDERLVAMAERARSLGRPHAASTLADLVERVAGGEGPVPP